MNGFAVLVTLAVVGVDYGWQPAQDGQLEYIVQIEPALLERMKSGYEIESVIHPDARGVRKFRIRVGSGPLPRRGQLQPETTPTRLSMTDGRSSTPPSGLGAPNGAAPPAAALGVLNLPPPPALIGPDGKASVLVRPGEQNAAPANTPTGTSNWTAPAAERARGATVPLSIPGPPSNGRVDQTGGGGYQLPNLPQPPMTRLPADPNSGSAFPAHGSSGPGASGGFGSPSSPEAKPVGPIPAPANDQAYPAPIRDLSKEKNNSPVPDRWAADNHGFRPPAVREDPTGSNRETASEPKSSTLMDRMAANQQNEASKKPTIDQETAEKLEAMQSAKPWLPLVLTSLALFASLAANVYLGWIAVSVYRRYRDMVDQLHETRATLTQTA